MSGIGGAFEGALRLESEPLGIALLALCLILWALLIERVLFLGVPSPAAFFRRRHGPTQADADALAAAFEGYIAQPSAERGERLLAVCKGRNSPRSQFLRRVLRQEPLSASALLRRQILAEARRRGEVEIARGLPSIRVLTAAALNVALLGMLLVLSRVLAGAAAAGEIDRQAWSAGVLGAVAYAEIGLLAAATGFAGRALIRSRAERAKEDLRSCSARLFDLGPLCASEP